jgi:hypothetical protein
LNLLDHIEKYDIYFVETPLWTDDLDGYGPRPRITLLLLESCYRLDLNSQISSIAATSTLCSRISAELEELRKLCAWFR